MPPSSTPEQGNHLPLCVDLDDALIKTDLFWEYVVRWLRQKPFEILPILFWAMRGRAFLEQQLARRISLDPIILPRNEPFLAFLRQQKNAGRKLILVADDNHRHALPAVRRLGLFDEFVAGRSNAGPMLASQASAEAKSSRAFETRRRWGNALFRSMRPHQWVKNLIVFVPLIAAHKLNEPSFLLNDVCAFVAFCLCASGVYLVNDLVDLDADRQHPTKKNRPLAAGDLPLQIGLILGPLLLVAGMAMASHLSWLFVCVTAAYLFLTTAYSWWVKQIVLLDVFFLAGLYTMRLVAGSAATGIVNSSWLLMFSMFIFLSLALVKRYVELVDTAKFESKKSAVAGRGYLAHDLGLVTSLGTGSGYLAALVLALYVNSDQVTKLYTHQTLLLLVCPLMLYWISRVWLLAHRGLVHEDPVVFTLKDKTSYVLGFLICLILLLAAGQP